ncbi:thermonuclease family protein [Salinibacter ruber]
MPSPDRDPNAGGPTTGENRSGGENTPESLPDREDRWPASGLIPAAVEVVFLETLSGDALRVGLPVSEAHAPERPEAATGRIPAAVYLWGIQAPRPGQPFGAAATEAASRICEGKRLRVAARRAGPEGRITGSVVAEGKETSERQDVGRALIRLGLAWQDQRGPSSAQLRSLEQESRREEVGLWQQEARPHPGPGGSETRWEKPHPGSNVSARFVLGGTLRLEVFLQKDERPRHGNTVRHGDQERR